MNEQIAVKLVKLVDPGSVVINKEDIKQCGNKTLDKKFIDKIVGNLTSDKDNPMFNTAITFNMLRRNGVLEANTYYVLTSVNTDEILSNVFYSFGRNSAYITLEKYLSKLCEFDLCRKKFEIRNTQNIHKELKNIIKAKR